MGKPAITAVKNVTVDFLNEKLTTKNGTFIRLGLLFINFLK
jgi:hypothetical protein